MRNLSGFIWNQNWSLVNFVVSCQLLELVPLGETIVLDLAVGLEVAEQGVDFVFEVVLRRSRSEVVLVNVDVAEQEETVRTVAATVVDQESVTTQLRRRDCVEFLGVNVVAVAGEQELEIKRREPREAGFVESVCVYLRLGLSERFVVVFPENRALRGDGFEALAMEMMDEFTGELVEAVEVGVKLVAAVGRPDKPTVAKPLEDPVDRVAVVVAPVGDLGDGSRLVEVVQYLECLAGQQFGELDVGVLADEILIEFDGTSVRWDDSFSPAIAVRVDEPLLDEVADGTREVTLAVVELRRELRDRVAAVDRGEDLKFDAPEHGVT